MRWIRPISIRGKLVLWYLGVLAALLLALGVFQFVTLSSYLRSSTEDTLRHAAYQELAVLAPCYLGSSTELRRNAAKVAQLLGGHDTAVTIVTPAGQTLATHGLGPPGDTKPLQLSRSTVRRLVGSSGAARSTPPAGISVSTCPQPFAFLRLRRHRAGNQVAEWANSLVSPGGLLLVAVPLGPPGTIVGYAIVGRSLAPANATLVRVLLVFVLGAAAVLLLAALVALPIINRALQPLRRVTETAEAIAGGDLEQRAHLAHSHDEVGRLGEAFDAMVDRMQAAMAETAASEERMRRFLADASHELRTPATVLRGASQVLVRQGAYGQPELLAPLRDMHEEAIRLSRLVDDLLTLSRLDAGQQMAPQPVAVRRFLNEFVERYGSVWPNRTIHLDVGGLDGTRAHVDPEALRRMLTNLVDNAARYSRAGGAITIAGKPAASTIAIDVSDEGPGLRPEDARRVFDRFYRANKSRSRDSGGTGLGLAIVHGLVEQSGGKIDMETGPDRGTTVTVILPRVEEEEG